MNNLIPQVESALRDLLAALGGVITKPDRHGGSQKISLGEVLANEKFAQVPEAIRFHMQLLYHSVVPIGIFRLKAVPDAGV